MGKFLRLLKISKLRLLIIIELIQKLKIASLNPIFRNSIEFQITKNNSKNLMI